VVEQVPQVQERHQEGVAFHRRIVAFWLASVTRLQRRRRARLLRALGWIAEGRLILEVAIELGYESPSAFSAMFRRELGAPPSSFRE
jgi:AraC-like DNA-binding protein